MKNKTTNIIILILIANIIFATVKFTIGHLQGSGVLLAESIHGAIDVFFVVITLIGIKVQQKKGKYNYEAIIGIILSFLLVVMCLDIIVDGIEIISDFQKGEEIEATSIYNIFYLIPMAVIKFLLYFYLKNTKEEKTDVVVALSVHQLIDALTTLTLILVIGLVNIFGQIRGFMLVEPIATFLFIIYALKEAQNIFISSRNKLGDEEKLDKRIRKITIGAMMIGIGVITRFFTIQIPILGSSAFRIEVHTIIIALSGMILGPIYGAIVGGGTDLIGFHLHPMGDAYIYGFTINAILYGLVGGLVTMLIKKVKIKYSAFITSAIILISYLSLAIYIIFYGEVINAYRLSIELTTVNKFLFLLAIGICIGGIIYLLLRCYFKNNDRLLRVLLIVLINDLLIAVPLTSYWLEMTYDIPYILAFLIRGSIKLFIIPLHLFLLYRLTLIVDKKIQPHHHHH